MRTKQRLYGLLAVLFFWVLFHPSFSFAAENQTRRVERDTDGDGKIDQVAHVDPEGRPVRLEIDADANDRFEKIQ
ncbi:MAG: hypothetical protein PHV70_14890, partial [Desulfobacteraceae bacterium]|nr:hypothetical protein [Desulfobacteraceae bacterium]